MSIGELTGQNVTTGPEVSEGNERTVRVTVINWMYAYVQGRVKEKTERKLNSEQK